LDGVIQLWLQTLGLLTGMLIVPFKVLVRMDNALDSVGNSFMC